MSAHQSSFNPEQFTELTAKLEATKQALVSSLTEVMTANQEKIIGAAKAEIDQVVTKDQRIVLTVQAGAEKDKPEKRSKGWEITLLIVPIICTAGLGFAVWFWQSRLQQKIDHQGEVIKTELALKEEFGKRKLDFYQQILKEMVELGSKVRAGQRNPDLKALCGPALLKFNETVKSNRIYISDEAFQALLDFWQVSADVLRGQSTLDDLQTKNSAAEDRIAKDLDVKNLGKLKLDH